MHRVLFDRIKDFGLECCRDYQERPTPTHRMAEIDYVFVSRELIPQVTAESVVDTGGFERSPRPCRRPRPRGLRLVTEVATPASSDPAVVGAAGVLQRRSVG